MQYNFKKILLASLAALMLISAAGCGSNNSKPAATNATTGVTGSITGSGSSALLPLVKDAAAKFKETNKGVSISLNAGGSGTGLKQVADGSVDMGNSDVPAASKLPKEKADNLMDNKVCVMTVATIVNKDVAAKVKSLTSQQLQEKAGVSVRVIWKAKQGARLSPRSAGRLARALGVTVAEIAN